MDKNYKMDSDLLKYMDKFYNVVVPKIKEETYYLSTIYALMVPEIHVDEILKLLYIMEIGIISNLRMITDYKKFDDEEVYKRLSVSEYFHYIQIIL